MNDNTRDTLTRLAASGLEACLHKINSVAPGAWRLENLTVRAGSAADALGPGRPGVIRITVQSAPPMITLLVFTETDAELLFRAFVSDYLYGVLGPDRREVTLLELGNILLNALANSLLKAFRKSAIPSVPERIAPEPAAVTAPPAAAPAGGAPLTIVSARISMERDGRRAAVDVLALVPEGLAPEP